MKKHSAFTLIELLIVVAIIAILAAIAVPNFLEAQVRSKVSRALSDMRSMATAIECYRVDYNSYPAARMTHCYGPDDSNNHWLGYNTPTVNSAILGFNATPGGGTMDGFGAYWRMTFALPDPAVIASLTTPTAYMTSYPPDPFADTQGIAYGYTNMDNKMWVLWSFGPDADEWCEGQLGNASTSEQGNRYYHPLAASKEEALCLNFAKGFDVGGDYSWFSTTNGLFNKVLSPETSGATATLLTAGYTYDATNGTKSQGDVYRLKQ